MRLMVECCPVLCFGRTLGPLHTLAVPLMLLGISDIVKGELKSRFDSYWHRKSSSSKAVHRRSVLDGECLCYHLDRLRGASYGRLALRLL